MRWFVAVTVAALSAGVALPSISVGAEPAKVVFDYLQGSWGGGIAGEYAGNSRTGNIGTTVYSGTAKLTTDGQSVLQIGGWSKVGMQGQVGWARLYRFGKEPDKMVIYTYSTNADHAIVEAAVTPRGEFFEISGEETGVTTDRKVTASHFVLTIKDKDHFSIKSTSRRVDGVAMPDEVEEYVRKKN